MAHGAYGACMLHASIEVQAYRGSGTCLAVAVDHCVDPKSSLLYHPALLVHGFMAARTIATNRMLYSRTGPDSSCENCMAAR